MGAYIDRDELLELYANTDDLDISDYDVKVAVIRQNILDMPTIDLVRCGECIHKIQALSTEKGATGCELISGTFYEDFFCKEGKRKADYTVFTINPPKGIETPLKGDATAFHQNSKTTQTKGE